MEEKYNHSIKAGVIGGVAFIVIALISLAASLSGLRVVEIALGCLALLLAVIVAAVTGALAVRFARPLLNNLTDAAIVSAIAGLVAGIIYAVMRMVTYAVTAATTTQQVNTILSQYGLPSTYSNNSYLFGWLGQCCCAPFIVILVIIVAVIGGLIYGALIAKLH
jgi:hypothetical protein